MRHLSLLNFIAHALKIIEINIISMNPFIKNCKTGFHDDLLNRTSHYCKLLLTKTTINNKLSDHFGHLLQQNKKKDQEARRLKANEDLMKSLINIERRPGTLRLSSEG